MTEPLLELNAALRGLVSEAPASLVAEMLRYSYQVTNRHATAAATPYARYLALRGPSAGPGYRGATER